MEACDGRVSVLFTVASAYRTASSANRSKEGVSVSSPLLVPTWSALSASIVIRMIWGGRSASVHEDAQPCTAKATEETKTSLNRSFSCANCTDKNPPGCEHSNECVTVSNREFLGKVLREISTLV